MTSILKGGDGKAENKVKKILVMDDNVSLLKLLKRLLEQLDFEVELAKEGAEAISVYKEEMKKGNGFDLILVDLIIDEGIGGIETIEVIRKFDPNVKAIVISGELPEEIKEDHTKYGFDSYLEKPFQIEILKSAIEKVLT